MMRAALICIGKLDRVMFAPAAAEYEKRLSRFCKFDVIELSEGPVVRCDADIPKTLRAEGEKILSAIRPDDRVAALCIGGKSYLSEDFSRYIGRVRDEGRGRLVFVVGSSHGLCDEVIRRADDKISMSAMTFPHQLARVMLEEQIYRAFTILGGQTYHK